MRLLIVDDDVLSLSGLQILLERVGKVSTWCVRDLESACDAFTTQRFDGVITDYALGFSSGLQLAAWIREQNATIPILIITGFLGLVDQKTVNSLKIDLVLTKPLETAGLLAWLKTITTISEPSGTTSGPVKPALAPPVTKEYKDEE